MPAVAGQEDLFQIIGQCIADLVPADAELALAYAECTPSSVGCDVYFRHGAGVRFMFGSRELRKAWRQLWDAMRGSGPEPWYAAALTLDLHTGHFMVKYVYAENFDDQLDATERRQPFVDATFGDLPVDHTPVTP